MSEQMNLFADLELTKISSVNTHFYAKKDIAKIWGVTDLPMFERMIGEEGKQILKWRVGRQRFSPNQVRRLVDLLGPPLKKLEIGR